MCTPPFSARIPNVRERRAKRQAREILADWNLIWNPNYQRESVCRALTVLIRDEICPADPRQALPIAFLCLRLARRLRRAAARRCLIGCSWATLGTVHRVLADHSKAEKCYRFALRRAERCGCRRCRPDILRRLAYFRVDQGRNEDAKRLADEAVAAYRKAEDQVGIGRALLAQAMAECHLGQISNAIASTRAALTLVPASETPYYLAGLNNLAWYLCFTDACADLENALAALEHGWRRVRGRTKSYRMIRIRIRWVRAVVRYRLGKLRPCHLRRALDVAHRQICELGLYRDAAHLTAEAAEICAEMRAEDAADSTIRTLCTRLIRQDLPSQIRSGLCELLRAVDAVAREPLRRAASELRRVCSPCPIPGAAGIG